MKDRVQKLENLKQTIKNPAFIEIIEKKIDKIKNNKTINKNGN